GTGIGLRITAAIVKEFEGSISFRSEEGKGTEFMIDLPIASNESQKIHSAILEESTRPKLDAAVLVVDDEEGVREVLRDVLEQLGCRVDEAANGVEAFSKVQKRAYNLVLTDLKMPEMDGITLL